MVENAVPPEFASSLPRLDASRLSWDIGLFREGVGRAIAHFGRHKNYARLSFRYMRYWYSTCLLNAMQREMATSGLTIADMGIGDGIFPLFARSVLQEPCWIGLDMNQKRLDEAAGRYAKVLRGDFSQRLPLTDGQVDAVNFLHVIEHVPDEHSTLTEIHRVLRPGGVLIAASPVLPKLFARMRQRQFEREFAAGKRKPGKHIRVFWPERWREALVEHGFRPLDIRGGYFMRSRLNLLENFGWWARLNVLYGRLFPSLGNEVLVAAQKE